MAALPEGGPAEGAKEKVVDIRRHSQDEEDGQPAYDPSNLATCKVRKAIAVMENYIKRLGSEVITHLPTHDTTLIGWDKPSPPYPPPPPQKKREKNGVGDTRQ